MAAESTVRSEPEEPPRRRPGPSGTGSSPDPAAVAQQPLLYRIDHYSSLPWAALVVAAVLVGGMSPGGFGFSTGWLTGFEMGTSVVTLMMLFVIQHTQSREQAATQRKLDELLRAPPEAESGLMMLEEASDDEMRDVEADQRESKENAVSTSESPT